MTKNPAGRLGCIDGEDSIRKHPFFKGKNKKIWSVICTNFEFSN
jgi:hypothetical protein